MARIGSTTHSLCALGLAVDRASQATDLKKQNIEDERLMRRVADGDQDAFSALVRSHSAQLYRVAFRILSDSHEAEDVVQQVFSKLWQTAPNWKSKGKGLGAWLKKVTVNRSIDRYRKVRIVSSEPHPEPVDKAPNQHHILEMKELNLAVTEALNALPIRHKTAIILSYYEGYTNSVSADILGLNLKAMESLLVRARRNMQDLLVKKGVAGADMVFAR